MFNSKELQLEGSMWRDTLGINAAKQIATQVPGPLHNTSKSICNPMNGVQHQEAVLIARHLDSLGDFELL